MQRRARGPFTAHKSRIGSGQGIRRARYLSARLIGSGRARRFLAALEAQLAEASTAARRAQYSALASPALAVSLDGFAGGRGGGWRAAHGLVGARSFAEQELRAVAAQVQAAF